ncbi:MAG: hypothetical protein MZV63_36045 [Marinilabiliales bacterium]|nr:hypothetical protein [Marinilabiliales bacterium]
MNLREEQLPAMVARSVAGKLLAAALDQTPSWRLAATDPRAAAAVVPVS